MHILQKFTLTVVYVYRIVRPRKLVYAVAEHRDALTEFAARKPHHDIGLAGLEIDPLQHRLAPLARAFPQHAVDILQALRIARPQMGIYGLYVVSVHYGLHRFRERRTAARRTRSARGHARTHHQSRHEDLHHHPVFRPHGHYHLRKDTKKT